MIAERDSRRHASWPSRLDEGKLAELEALFGDWPGPRQGRQIDLSADDLPGGLHWTTDGQGRIS